MTSEKTQVTWIGPELRLLGETSTGAAVVVDYVLPDEDRPSNGPAPMELLLTGLAGCTSMDVLSILRKKRQPFTGLQVKATGERREEHPKIFTKIHLEFIVTGAEVDPKAVERAIELSQNKYCSAAAMLREAAEITTSYRILAE